MASSAASRRKADLQQRDRAAVDRIALLAGRSVLNSLQRVPLKAFLERKGDHKELNAVLTHNLLNFAPTLRDSMLAAYLRGRYRSAMDLGAYLGSRKRTLGKFDDVISYFLAKLMMSPDDVKQVQNQFGQDAVKILRGASDVLEEKLQNATVDIVGEGMHLKGGIARMRQAFDAAGVTPDSPFLLETLVRTEVQKAYGAGAWHADQTPDMQEYLQGYEYVTVGDYRVRPTHTEMDGAIAAKDDPVWNKWWPPCGFNCRCGVVKIYNDEDMEENLPSPLPEPDEGFGVNWGKMV